MPDDDKKLKPSEWGKAKAAFNEVSPPPPPVRATPAFNEAGKTFPAKVIESEMVKKTKLAPAPKPPGFAGQMMAQQAHNKGLAKEHQAAKTLQPKPPRSLEDQQAIDKLNAKFRQAAKREREQDRGR